MPTIGCRLEQPRDCNGLGRAQAGKAERGAGIATESQMNHGYPCECSDRDRGVSFPAKSEGEARGDPADWPEDGETAGPCEAAERGPSRQTAKRGRSDHQASDSQGVLPRARLDAVIDLVRLAAGGRHLFEQSHGKFSPSERHDRASLSAAPESIHRLGRFHLAEWPVSA
jgi:hypothetical protein